MSHCRGFALEYVRMSLTIGRKVAFGFGLMILLLLALGGATHQALDRIDGTAGRVGAIARLQETVSGLAALEGQKRGAIAAAMLSPEPAAADRIRGLAGEVDAAL